MIGSRIGPYRVLGDLGSGGMGKVYLAEVEGKAPGLDAGLRVALKVIHPHLLETPGFFKRFLREAEIGRSVEQANVVRCFDCDSLVVEGTRHDYLVMEYVEGQTLRDLLKELERVPEELCRHIGREIAKGLVAIHAAGVIHRDLKPENVLITEDHVVKVMDLGVARLQDEVVRLSQTGAFVGSLEYACPEQFRGGGAEVDVRSDLYALGVTLYELSTGQHPYRTDDTSTTLHNVIEGKCRRAGEVNPQLSPFFEEVVHALAAKEPGERFSSASSLLTVLEDGDKSDWWRERAKALRIETKRPLRRIRIPRETALYGRDDDLAEVHALYENAKAGDGRVLLIEGEAGIGKTRLVDEFVGRLRQEGEDINFLFGSYPPGGAATAAGAFSTAYREHFGEERLEETLKGYVKPTPILIPAFAALLKGEMAPEGKEPLTKDSLQTVFVHATRGLAAERTTVVLIDDLHFAPEDGRALFTSLALAVPDHRILLVGTMRPGVPVEWVAGVTRLDHAEQRSLSRLGPKDLGKLLRDAFRSDKLAEELGFKISEKSDGNPFFAFEIIRGLREGQFISQHADGTWVTTKVIHDIQVPSSVLDLVNARVADLSEEERDLLDVASCCGFEFEAGLVADAVGVARIPALKRFGQIERRHRLVRTSGRKCVFDHHQVQEALYGSLMSELREEYHAAIAEALETRAGAADKDPKELDGALCVDLSEHFLKGAQGERARRYLDVALDHLEAGYLNGRMVELVDRALAVPGGLTTEARLDSLLRKSRSLAWGLGRPQAAESVLVEALALARDLGGSRRLADVEFRIGNTRGLRGLYEDAAEHYQQALAHCRDFDSGQMRAGIHGALGHALVNLSRNAEAEEQLTHCLTLARDLGDLKNEAGAAQTLGNLLCNVGRYDASRAYHERAVALCIERGARVAEARARGDMGIVFFLLGQMEQARTQFEMYLTSARETGERRGQAYATGNLALVFSSLGRYAEALRAHERYLVLAREIGDRRAEAIVLHNLGGLLARLGSYEEARRCEERSVSIAQAIGDQRCEGYALADLSAIALEEGEVTTACHLADQAANLRREIGHAPGVADSLIQRGEIHLQAGGHEQAREALDEAADLLRQQGRKPKLAHALALLANLPDGDPAEAELALEEAGEAGNTPQTRYYLWKATGKHEHLAEARRLLDYRVEHAPEEYRESMLANVRLNREIMEAWEESQDPERAKRVEGHGGEGE